MFEVAASSTLAGRRQEQAQLAALWTQAASGRLAVVLVAGEPGIGKSRLLAALREHVRAAGGLALAGGASEAEGMPPYLPLLEALGSFIRGAAPEILRDVVQANGATLAVLLPELAARLGELAPAYPLPPEQARFRLFEAVADMLPELAARQPVLLTLDDLQWADRATLELLTYLTGHRPQARVLIVGAYRPDEHAANPALEQAIGALERQRVLTHLLLAPLTKPELTVAAAGWLAGPVEPSLGAALFRHSEGNPFFAEELLADWRERGVIQRAAVPGGGWQLTGVLPAMVPPSLERAVRARYSRLPGAVVELLRVAAIIGRVFSIELLAEAAGREGEWVEEQLTVAVRAGLLRVGKEGLYAFAHDKIRASLYSEVTPLRRRRLHGYIGRALEDHSASAHLDEAARLAALAYHCAHSGDRARGALASIRAAEAAERAYAPAEAAAHYQMALALSAPEAPKRAEWQIALGEAAILAGLEDLAESAFAAAEATALANGQLARAGAAAYGRARAIWRQERIAEAEVALVQAQERLQSTGGALLARVLVDLATLRAINLGWLAEGIATGRQALALAEQVGDPRLEAAAARVVGNLLVRNGSFAEGIPLLERALACAAAADDPAEEAEAAVALLFAAHWAGHFRRIRGIAERYRQAAERARDLFQLRHVYIWMAVVAAFHADWEAADRALAQAWDICTRLHSPEPRAFWQHMASQIALFRGEIARACELGQQAIAAFRTFGPDQLIWYLGPHVWSLWLADRRAEALAALDELRGLAESVPPTSILTAEAGIYLALMAIETGDRAAAVTQYQRLRPFAGRSADYAIDEVLGRLALFLGDWLAAEAHLRAAVAYARTENDRSTLARALAAQAELAQARGDLAQARQLGERALAHCTAAGLGGDAGWIRRRLGALAPDQPAGASRPAGLTAREVEVLRLVAAGQSNRQIAETLVLSEKTVINHLTAIFRKIGAENRAAAAAYAIRHRLA